MRYRLAFCLLLVVVISTAAGCNRLRERRIGPGVAGPGPGVVTDFASYEGEVMMAGAEMEGATSTAQVEFRKPQDMQISWDVHGIGEYDSTPLVVPGRNNFPQGGMYRLKLQNVAQHSGKNFYPTLEVGLASPRTAAFLAHNAIPVQFTTEDFDQATSGNFVTKVIYLPNPEYQELALAGVETLVSTRLDPGVDPIVEADRRGSILAIVRMGNKDMEMPGMQEEMSILAGGGYIPGGTIPSGGPISGVNVPEFGIPQTETAFGIPGPAQLPTAGGAGLHRDAIHRREAPSHLHERPRSPGDNFYRPADFPVDRR
ncbi:MAG: hypothetical protein MPJ24_11160 [Pirellulaceae bacterium]|nr:hypothetical protein [Pirellulaceae bacterium]